MANPGNNKRMVARSMRSVSVDAPIGKKKNQSRLAARAFSVDSRPVVLAENNVFSVENAARASVAAADDEIVNNNNTNRPLPHRSIRSVSVDDPSQLQKNLRRRRRAATRTVSADVIFEENSGNESESLVPLPIIIRQPTVLLNRVETPRPVEIVEMDLLNRENALEISRTVDFEPTDLLASENAVEVES